MSAQPQKVTKIEQPLNIYQRINEVRKKVNYVRKDKTVSTGSGNGGYKATTHDAVTALVRNHLIEHGVLIVPKLRGSSVVDAGQTKGGTPIIRYEAKYEIEFVNCDMPGDVIVVPVEAHANDSGDKAPGKAVSYATKYAILKLFNIETGEDEESRVEPYGGVQKVSQEQIDEMEKRIADYGVDRSKFMAFCKISDLSEILAKNYEAVLAQLERKKPK